MENVHRAIAWYQTKIGSYDKQLWEQSVEKKLQKQPHFVLHGAPRKNVHLKTEYIDVDLIQGSMFTKTMPQVPWVYVTRKAVARVLFFPFYFNWWVHQTSKKLYMVLLVLYVLQVVTVLVYLGNFDRMEDELCFTEVILPIILMFLLCLIHSQTVLAHITHKPPKHIKSISGVTLKPRPRKTSRRIRSSDNNSTCQEDDGNTETRASKRKTINQHISGVGESRSLKNIDNVIPSSLNMEESLLSRSVSDYDLKPAIKSTQNDVSPSASLTLHRRRETVQNEGSQQADRVHDKLSNISRQSSLPWGKEEVNIYSVHGKWGNGGDNPSHVCQKSGCSYNLLDNLPNLLTVEKVVQDTSNVIRDEGRPKNLTEGRRYEKNRHATNMNVQHTNLQTCCDDSCCSGRICCENSGSRRIAENAELNLGHDVCGSARVCCCGAITKDVFNNGSIDANSKSFGVNEKTVSSVRMSTSKSGADVRSRSFGTSTASQTFKDVGCGASSYGNEELRDSVSKYPLKKCSCLAEVKLNRHDADCKVSIGHQSTNDKLRPSDFEVVDQPTLLRRKSSDLSSTSQLSSISTSSQIIKKNIDIRNLSQTSPVEYSSAITDVEPKPSITQNSCTANINNASHTTYCSFNRSLKDAETTNSNEHCCHVTYSDDIFLRSSKTSHLFNSQDHEVCAAELSCCARHVSPVFDGQDLSSQSDTCSSDPPSVKDNIFVPQICENSNISKTDKKGESNIHQISMDEVQDPLTRSSTNLHENHIFTKSTDLTTKQDLLSFESSLPMKCFSESFAQEILNENTLRVMSCSSLLANSDLENSSSSTSRLSSASTVSSATSSSCKIYKTHTSPLCSSTSTTTHENVVDCCQHHLHNHHNDHMYPVSSHHHSREIFNGEIEDERNDPFEESLEQINMSEEERRSDDVSNYNPSDSDVESDGSVNEDIHNRYSEKWKRLRFQEQDNESECDEKAIIHQDSKNTATGTTAISSGIPASKTAKNGFTTNAGGSRSVVEILTRKPSPLKDLALGRKSNSNTPVINSSGSDKEQSESRNQLRRRRLTSGTTYEMVESGRNRNIPNTLGLRPSDTKIRQLSSSENEIGGVHTPEESNKATISSEEWEDRIQSDETTSSAYSSNSDVDPEDKVEEDVDEKTETAPGTFHVFNLLQPQNGSPTTSGIITQPDRVSCLIWEGSECKKLDLTALDIGWAIIDKVDSLPESSDYFMIGLLFSFIICMVPLVFRAYANRELTGTEDFQNWSGLASKLAEMSALVINSYSWRQYLLMVNGILQRFFLSLVFFFLLSVADRTFKQRLLYAKHFSYLTSSRRARKFSMPHFRLNKVRNIKIWLSLRSYLKRRGPQRSVDVIVSACFLVTVSIACLISIQMLKDTDSYLDCLCNWELLVWCTALGVFLMRFMTLGLKINKKYRNLSVLITEQINLYLQMEQKPHKKEELILANNVLRLAEDLLKELESPFKISGFSANPLIYNIMRIVVLSAFSAVLTEVLGFKLKLHKIKLKD